MIRRRRAPVGEPWVIPLFAPSSDPREAEDPTSTWGSARLAAGPEFARWRRRHTDRQVTIGDEPLTDVQPLSCTPPKPHPVVVSRALRRLRDEQPA